MLLYRWPARSIVQSSLDNRFNIHNSGKIAVLNHFCPWKEHLFEIEKEVSFGLISTYFSLILVLDYGLFMCLYVHYISILAYVICLKLYYAYICIYVYSWVSRARSYMPCTRTPADRGEYRYIY